MLFTEKVLPKSKTVRVHLTHNRTSRTITANAKVDPICLGRRSARISHQTDESSTTHLLVEADTPDPYPWP
jgi:hypothetical protein